MTQADQLERQYAELVDKRIEARGGMASVPYLERVKICMAAHDDVYIDEKSRRRLRERGHRI